MILRDISLDDPQENLLLDDVFLSLAEDGLGEETLRFWESARDFIVLGRVCKPEEDLKAEAILNDNIPVLRRSSGGGTVIQGQGCVNYSLILSKEDPQVNDLRRSYQYILGKIVSALAQLKINAAYLPISDIVLKENEKKFSGNAQKRGRRFILHHGTILYRFDLQKIEKYLTIPRLIPEYRRGRGHLDFVTNIDVSLQELKKHVSRVFNVERAANILNESESVRLKKILSAKNFSVGIFNE